MLSETKFNIAFMYEISFRKKYSKTFLKKVITINQRYEKTSGQKLMQSMVIKIYNVLTSINDRSCEVQENYHEVVARMVPVG